ncbi:MAG: hypothetical protein GY820_40360 [Gammaproteobacteria bacterium]|nr:hypothetical protein [Gammaproteobacteria bacterium]
MIGLFENNGEITEEVKEKKTAPPPVGSVVHQVYGLDFESATRPQSEELFRIVNQ